MTSTRFPGAALHPFLRMQRGQSPNERHAPGTKPASWYIGYFRERTERVPLYEYKCVKCGKHSEKIEKYTGPHLKKCPHCKGRVVRLMSAPAIQFKGTGWYVTDYARASSGGSDKGDGGGASEKSEASQDSKSDSKSESKGESKSGAKSESKSDSRTEGKGAASGSRDSRDNKDKKKSAAREK